MKSLAVLAVLTASCGSSPRPYSCEEIGGFGSSLFEDHVMLRFAGIPKEEGFFCPGAQIISGTEITVTLMRAPIGSAPPVDASARIEGDELRVDVPYDLRVNTAIVISNGTKECTRVAWRPAEKH
ncbi:MAG TPA: hypothetical protein VGR31_11975 [Planctomycetota bacterium]|jgi:hypothetical protein|nr:hypothetical protein [Planctomycetota bacterium]